MACFKCYLFLDPLSPHRKKNNVVGVGPSLAKLSGSAHVGPVHKIVVLTVTAYA